jgi:hypothetical protein
MIALAPQVSTREELHGAQTCLIFVAGESQATLPDTQTDLVWPTLSVAKIPSQMPKPSL